MKRWKLNVGYSVARGLACLPLVLVACARQENTEGVSLEPAESAPGQKFDFRRAPSTSSPAALVSQMKPLGAPGVAVVDLDSDGDLDVYVTNGPGAENPVYSNQLRETGRASFTRGAGVSGLDAVEQDSTGACYADVDNDGDPDVVVLGNGDGNRLFLNVGGGAFKQSTTSGIEVAKANSMSCSFGDVNGDGLVDLAVANTFDMTSIAAIGAEAFAQSQPNQLLLNRGDGTFEDVSKSAGIWKLDFPKAAPISAPSDAATITWAIALVDYDADGDLDWFQADDQGALPNTIEGGIDRGFPHVLQNDGSGHFTDVTFKSGIRRTGGWMGLAFADFNRDGLLDFFGTNFGNHTSTIFYGGVMPEHQENDSRWFLQRSDGGFTDSLDLVGRQNSPFGWGVVAEDFDNDADSDVAYFGGEDLWLFIGTTPPAALENDGRGGLARNRTLVGAPQEYLRRAVNGVAAGDLNADGFVDLVTVSSFDLSANAKLTSAPSLGGVWDTDAFYVPASDDVFANLVNGSLSVAMSDGANRNGSLQLTLVGSVGLTARARSNRDGIGALISVWPEGGVAADLRPVLGGASYASQSSLTQTFGLGRAAFARALVRWPGGNQNRLAGLRAGERLKAFEVPCSATTSPALAEFTTCVDRALADLARSDTPAALARYREVLLDGFNSKSWGSR